MTTNRGLDDLVVVFIGSLIIVGGTVFCGIKSGLILRFLDQMVFESSTIEKIFNTNKYSGYLTPTPTLTPEQFTKELIRLTNEERIKAKQKALAENDLLNKSATMKAQDMLAKNYWAHDAPDGTKPWAWLKKVGYNYQYAGENLAKDFNNPSSIIKSWMNSPEHKENILDPKFTQVGIGIANSESELGIGIVNRGQDFLVVQHFGSPFIQPPNHVSNGQPGTRTGKIIKYKEWCSNTDINIYSNELITQRSTDGNVYSLTKGDWDCYEKYLSTKSN